MTVFVDSVRRVTASAKWPYTTACHLTADTLEELHEMAARLSLQRSWFQPHATFPHYDLTAKKRAQAIRLGAVPESTVAAVRRMRHAMANQAARGES